MFAFPLIKSYSSVVNSNLPTNRAFLLFFYLTVFKYAQRARTIVNRAVINEDPNAKIIRGLLEVFSARANGVL